MSRRKDRRRALQRALPGPIRLSGLAAEDVVDRLRREYYSDENLERVREQIMQTIVERFVSGGEP